jgi:sugar O-acyltransferase (sialic acid O-acetyltransferase NeuD family)
MKKPIVLFGMGPFAQIAKDYFNDDSDYEVIAFTLDDEYIEKDVYEDLPMVPFSKVVELYPPNEVAMHIALVYTDMNRLREKKYFEAKNKGYTLPSYISSKCTFLSKNKIGDNCFIFEDNTIQPYVEIANNVILWSGNHIGHHSIIKEHNFISSHVVISGQCVIESNCFLGVNSSVAHKTIIKRETLVGSGVSITRNTEEKGIYVPSKYQKLEKTSDQIKL